MEIKELQRRVRAIRSTSVLPMSISRAVRLARYTEAKPRYDFLSDLDTAPGKYEGEVEGFTVTVKVVPDEDSRLGEDDVTGHFSDTPEDGAIKNTRRDWNSDYKYYIPSNYDRTELPKDLERYGMSKSVREATYRARIKEAMCEDASLDYLGITVEVELDGISLGSASLWGIAVFHDSVNRASLCDAADELIEEAIEEARECLPEVAADMAHKVDALKAKLESVQR